MPPYGEADWATPGNTTTSISETPGITATPIAAVSSPTSKEGQRGTCYIVLLSLLNLGLSACMGALGVLNLITIQSGHYLSTDSFLSLYMVIFATLLFLYEFIWWQPVASINIVFRKNFGFLYGLRGKGLYMVFIAFLTIGIIRDKNPTAVKGLNWITGIGWFVSGFLHVFVACSVPGSNDLYRPPTAGLSQLGEDTNSNV